MGQKCQRLTRSILKFSMKKDLQAQISPSSIWYISSQYITKHLFRLHSPRDVIPPVLYIYIYVAQAHLVDMVYGILFGLCRRHRCFWLEWKCNSGDEGGFTDVVQYIYVYDLYKHCMALDRGNSIHLVWMYILMKDKMLYIPEGCKDYVTI